LFIAWTLEIDFKFGFAALQHSRDERQAQAAFFAENDAPAEFVHVLNIVLAGDLLESRKRNVETYAARYHKNKKTQNSAQRNSAQRNSAQRNSAQRNSAQRNSAQRNSALLKRSFSHRRRHASRIIDNGYIINKSSICLRMSTRRVLMWRGQARCNDKRGATFRGLIQL